MQPMMDETEIDAELGLLYVPGIWAGRLHHAPSEDHVSEHMAYVDECFKWSQSFEPLWKKSQKSLGKDYAPAAIL